MGLGCNKHANCIKKSLFGKYSVFICFVQKTYTIFHEPLDVTEIISPSPLTGQVVVD